MMPCTGMPRMRPDVRYRNQSGKPLIGLPLVMNRARPAAADMVARVATNGWIRPTVDSTPLIVPMRAPTSTLATNASPNGTPTSL